MKPILYPRSYTTFIGNGVGVLSDVLYCRSTEVLNGSYEIELQVPRNGNHADAIDVDCVIRVKANYDDDPQPFRIYSVEKDYDGYITVKAAHLTYDTAGIPILPFKVTKLADAVDKMNENRKVNFDSDFKMTADFDLDGDLEVTSPSSFRYLLGGSDNTIQAVYGGDYHYDEYTVELLAQRGVAKGICFRYSKNITGFEHEINSEDLYSAVFGYWKKSGENGKEDTVIYSDIFEVENVLPYDKILIVDASDKIKNEDNSDVTEAQLNEFMEQYIADNSLGIPKYEMKIDYAENNSIIQVNLGDYVGVLFPDYGINQQARVTKVVFDCLLERNESIEIGIEEKENVSSNVAKTSNDTQQLSSSVASNLAGIASDISKLMNGADEVTYFNPEVGASYEGYGRCWYAKQSGFVHVHLGISGLTSGQTVEVFTLPEGFRPISFVTGGGFGNAMAINPLSDLSIDQDGNLGSKRINEARMSVTQDGKIRVSTGGNYAVCDCIFASAAS